MKFYRLLTSVCWLLLAAPPATAQLDLGPNENFAVATVSGGHSAAATTITLRAGEGARLPAASSGTASTHFNAVWWNASNYPNPADDPNVEIVRVTHRSTDTLTVTRAQEGTSASTKSQPGRTYKLMVSLTKKGWDEIRYSLPTSGSGSPEGVVDGHPGRVYIDTAGPATYTKQSNLGTLTGWAAGGTPDDNSVTSAKIVDGTIVNADVNASAAIAASKLNLDNAVIFNPTLWSAGLNFRPVTDAAGTYFSITTNMPSEAPGHYGLEINTGMPIPLGDLDVFDADSDGNQLVVRGITDGSMMLIGTNEGGHVTLVRHRAINNGGLAYSLEETLLSSAGGYAHRFVGGTNKSVAINEQNAVAGVALHHYFDLLTSGGMHRSGTDPYMSFVDRNRNSASNRVDFRMDFGGFLVQMGANNYSSMTNAFWVRPGSGNGSPLIELNADVVQVRNSLSVLGALTGDGSGLTALNASNLGSGTLPDARFPATLPAASGANLTDLNAAEVTVGVLPDTAIPDPLPAVSGTSLTGVAKLAGGNAVTGDNSFTGLRIGTVHDLGTVSGGALTIANGTSSNLTNWFKLTLNGASVTNLINLPSTPLAGQTLLFDFTVTENSANWVTTFAVGGSSLAMVWEGRGYTSSTYTNTAATAGSSTLALRYTGAEWKPVAAGDNWVAPVVIPDNETVTGWSLGVSTATTPAATENSTRLATTEWVNDAKPRVLYINAGAMIPTTTAGAATATVELPTNKIMFDALDFDASTDEFAGVWFTLPSYYQSGTVAITFHWTAASGSGDVMWTAGILAFPNDAAMDTAVTLPAAAADTLLAANDMHVGPTFPTETIQGSAAANVPCYIRISRDADNAGDTLAADARLLGITITFPE